MFVTLHVYLSHKVLLYVICSGLALADELKIPITDHIFAQAIGKKNIHKQAAECCSND